MKHILLVAFLCFSFSVYAEHKIRWYNPQESLGYYIQNQGWNEDGGNYHRLPDRAKGKVRDAVWNLSCHSSGLSVRFISDAERITIRYQVSGGLSMPHMPSTGVSGIDMYRKTEGGEQICYGKYSFKDTICYEYEITSILDKSTKGEFEIFLPLYNEVKWMEIGVEENSFFEFIPVEMIKPIVVYGTSIAQGACASRPAMAWGNIIHRKINRPLINLGFSGNGRLEAEVIDFINELDAEIYIIDCMPNMNGYTSEKVQSLVEEAVKQIRQKHESPILLVEHAGYSNSKTNLDRDKSYISHNKGLREAYKSLISKNVIGLFYLSNEELNFHYDSWVDYVHPSDYGMIQQANALLNKLEEILK